MKRIEGRLPSWRAPERRAARPELWVLASLLVGMLLVEVWQSNRMAELSLGLDRTRTALEQADARLGFARADLELRSTRAQLVPLASRLGLAPPDLQQVVVLPVEYLANGPEPDRGPSTASLLGWAERVSRVLVPEARARGRTGS